MTPCPCERLLEAIVGVQVVRPIQPEHKQNDKDEPSMQVDTKKRPARKKQAVDMTTERDNLELHVDLCVLRYQQLNDRLEAVEMHIKTINAELDAFKAETNENFHELKDLISRGQGQKFQVMVATTGTIIVALIGMLGYVVTHIPK